MNSEHERDLEVIERNRRFWNGIAESNKRHDISDDIMTNDAQVIAAFYRAFDRLTARLAQLEKTCNTVLGVANSLNYELHDLDYDDCISGDAMENVLFPLYAAGIGSRTEREDAIKHLTEKAEYRRGWVVEYDNEEKYANGNTITPEMKSGVKNELRELEELISAIRSSLETNLNE